MEPVDEGEEVTFEIGDHPEDNNPPSWKVDGPVKVIQPSSAPPTFDVGFQPGDNRPPVGEYRNPVKVIEPSEASLTPQEQREKYVGNVKKYIAREENALGASTPEQREYQQFSRSFSATGETTPLQPEPLTVNEIKEKKPGMASRLLSSIRNIGRRAPQETPDQIAIDVRNKYGLDTEDTIAIASQRLSRDDAELAGSMIDSNRKWRAEQIERENKDREIEDTMSSIALRNEPLEPTVAPEQPTEAVQTTETSLLDADQGDDGRGKDYHPKLKRTPTPDPGDPTHEAAVFGQKKETNNSPEALKKRSKKELSNLDDETSWRERNLIFAFPDRYVGDVTDRDGVSWEIVVEFGDRARENNKQGIRLIDSNGDSISTTIGKSVFSRKEGNLEEGTRYIQTPNANEWYWAKVTKDADGREQVSDYKPVSKETGFKLMRLIAPFQDEVDDLRSNDIMRNQPKPQSASLNRAA